MIHIFTGTKAQLIKMAPIMLELQRRGLPYNYIDTGQHAKTTKELLLLFGLPKPDHCLSEGGNNISSIPQVVAWLGRILFNILVKHKLTCQRVFTNRGICLIHGDTLTTLISVIYAKICNQKIAHVEAGLRSYKLFDPFPEEIIRLLVMRFSDILFTPTQWAYENTCEMGYKEKSIYIPGNTGSDAVKYIVEKRNDTTRPDDSYIVVTIHRFETILSKVRLEFIIDLLDLISHGRKVLFVLHEPTERQLRRFKIYNRLLTNQRIKLLPLQQYAQFINLLVGAEFVITDGGSIQEECYYLGIPCLIMRNKTERLEGLGDMACLSEFSQKNIDDFLNSISMFERKPIEYEKNPSTLIVNQLCKYYE